MKKYSSRSEIAPGRDALSIVDLEKYLDFNSEIFYSDDEKSATQILPASEKLVFFGHSENKQISDLKQQLKETLQENELLKLQLEENTTGDTKLNLGKKYKRENIILTHELKKLNDEIKLLTNSHDEIAEELKKSQEESSHLRKIVKYVVDEVLGEYRSAEFKGDALSHIITVFNNIKTTVVSTQEAFLKQKKILKKLKTENFELRKENYSNLDLILKMNRQTKK